MSDRKSDPPGKAIWFLQNACPGDNEALTGDLVEKFRQGQTRGWFWKQVLIVFPIGIVSQALRRWPYFAYAFAGTVMPIFVGNAFKGLPGALQWWAVPWPLSQVVLELSRPGLLALAALTVLALGLAAKREFRPVALFRTGAISLTLITIAKYLLDIFLPWVSRPIAGDPYHRALIFPPLLQVLLFFSGFLVAAFLGCRSSHRTAESEERQTLKAG